MKMALLLGLILGACSAGAAPREVDGHHWVDVDRIIAIGDLHGDYDNYIRTLRAAGLIDQRGRWSAGATHLVQTGDIPDRGPDTKKIIAHLTKLARQARRKGGRVHHLIGNHEAMNVYGDLRYVTEGEYLAYASARSPRIRDRYFASLLKDFETRDPERFAELPADFRDRWYTSHPLGWIEHRQAWNPNWNPDAEMFEWVNDSQVAIQIDGIIFVHGGISGFYCRDTLESMTDRVHLALQRSDVNDLGILTDEFGPLWYRGLAGEAPAAPAATVEAILDEHGAAQIVVGHTPTGGIIWPRYGGQVIQIDAGISAAYGGHVAYLEVTREGMFAGYPPGKVALPPAGADLAGYLEKVLELLPDSTAAREKLEELHTAAESTAAVDQQSDSPTDEGASKTTEALEIPICGTRL